MELDELIKSVDIVSYITQYIELTQKGDEWWGLSCFKNEKTPSFSVRKEPPVFFDYSSGLGGNVYTFIRKYRKCSAKEAVDILKKYAGYDGELSAPREKMAATMICKRFAKPKQSEKSSTATNLPNDYMERYEKRIDKLAVWMDEGISSESLDRFQVYYDSFSNRLVYPIRNIEGKIVNIGGRTLVPDWKEKGLRKYTYFFGWGKLDTIYGLFENMKSIIQKHEVIIFEGCKSVLLANSWGVNNCAALLTSHLSPHQMKILARLGCDVVFALDKEIDIREDYNVKKLKSYVNVYYCSDKQNNLNDKDAPVDKGVEIFKELYNTRIKYR